MKVFRLAAPLPNEPTTGLVRFVHPLPAGEGYDTVLWNKPNQPLNQVAIDAFPKEITLPFKSPKSRVDFLLLKANYFVVSNKVRECIEAVEPHQHQFIPLQLVVPKSLKKQVIEAEYYFLNVCVRIDCIDIVLSDVQRGIGSLETYHLRTTTSRCVVRHAAIRGHHLWMSKRTVLSGDYFISGELKDHLEAKAVGEIRYHECELI